MCLSLNGSSLPAQSWSIIAKKEHEEVSTSYSALSNTPLKVGSDTHTATREKYGGAYGYHHSSRRVFFGHQYKATFLMWCWRNTIIRCGMWDVSLEKKESSLSGMCTIVEMWGLHEALSFKGPYIIGHHTTMTCASSPFWPFTILMYLDKLIISDSWSSAYENCDVHLYVVVDQRNFIFAWICASSIELGK